MIFHDKSEIDLLEPHRFFYLNLRPRTHGISLSRKVQKLRTQNIKCTKHIGTNTKMYKTSVHICQLYNIGSVFTLAASMYTWAEYTKIKGFHFFFSFADRSGILANKE